MPCWSLIIIQKTLWDSFLFFFYPVSVQHITFFRYTWGVSYSSKLFYEWEKKKCWNIFQTVWKINFYDVIKIFKEPCFFDILSLHLHLHLVSWFFYLPPCFHMIFLKQVIIFYYTPSKSFIWFVSTSRVWLYAKRCRTDFIIPESMTHYSIFVVTVMFIPSPYFSTSHYSNFMTQSCFSTSYYYKIEILCTHMC